MLMLALKIEYKVFFTLSNVFSNIVITLCETLVERPLENNISVLYFLQSNKKSDVANLGSVYRVLLTFKVILSNISFFNSQKTKLLMCCIGDKIPSIKPTIKVMS